MSEHREEFPYSLDEIDAILIGNDTKKLGELCALLKEQQGMSDAEIDRIITARHLRQSLHDAGEKAFAERLRTHPEPTDEERGMRAFAEDIESPVRDAVFTLRRKGYDTVSSGFSDFDWQSLAFSGPMFTELLAEHRAALDKLGVTVDADGCGLSFRPSSIDVETIRDTWNRIAEILPDRGAPAPARTSGGTARFRHWERNSTL